MSTRTTLRRNGSSVSTLELFYDLVFVFAITQVSHVLLEHLSWEGAGQTAIVLLVIWWSWNFTTWATNELNPDDTRVRALIVGLMLASLVMAIAIPHAFTDRALLFVGAYVIIQLGRTAFLAFVGGERGSPERGRAANILIWFSVAAAFWIAGALTDGEQRTILWLIALAIDYGGPLVTFTVPGRKMPHGAWHVDPEHMAERFQLFVIIALGESIVLTGATTSDLELSVTRMLAVAFAFLGTVALYWLYFRSVADRAGSLLAAADADRTLVARDIFTYLHVVLVAGVVLVAVGNELVIAHPDEHLLGKEMIALGAGPFVYLLAQNLMRLRAVGSLSVTRSAGMGGIVLATVIGSQLPSLVASALILLVLSFVVLAGQRKQVSVSA